MSYVFTHSLTLIRKVTDALDICFNDLLDKADIDQDLFEIADTTISADQYFCFLDEIVKQTGNKDIGLLCGRVSYIEGFHLYRYLASINKTVKEWINTVPTASSFLGGLINLEVRLTSEHLILEFKLAQPRKVERCIVSDNVMSSSVMLINSCSVFPVRPVRIDLCYSQPDDLSALNEVYRAPLHYNQSVNAIYYARSVLDQPLLHISTDIYGGVKDELDIVLSNSSSSWNADPFTVNLYTAIRHQLPSGKCSVNSVAKSLNISSRTLQRRLSERETSFQQFLQEVKSQLAIKYLENKNLNILDISLLLGYGGPTTFAAAFKSWHGVTPSDFRSQ